MSYPLWKISFYNLSHTATNLQKNLIYLIINDFNRLFCLKLFKFLNLNSFFLLVMMQVKKLSLQQNFKLVFVCFTKIVD